MLTNQSAFYNCYFIIITRIIAGDCTCGSRPLIFIQVIIIHTEIIACDETKSQDIETYEDSQRINMSMSPWPPLKIISLVTYLKKVYQYKMWAVETGASVPICRVFGNSGRLYPIWAGPDRRRGRRGRSTPGPTRLIRPGRPTRCYREGSGKWMVRLQRSTVFGEKMTRENVFERTRTRNADSN